LSRTFPYPAVYSSRFSFFPFLPALTTMLRCRENNWGVNENCFFFSFILELFCRTLLQHPVDLCIRQRERDCMCGENFLNYYLNFPPLHYMMKKIWEKKNKHNLKAGSIACKIKRKKIFLALHFVGLYRFVIQEMEEKKSCLFAFWFLWNIVTQLESEVIQYSVAVRYNNIWKKGINIKFVPATQNLRPRLKWL
jgi:hypothetical protein